MYECKRLKLPSSLDSTEQGLQNKQNKFIIFKAALLNKF